MTNEFTHDDDDRTDNERIFDRHVTRIAAGAYKDFQEVRISARNQVRDVVRKRNEGIPFDETEDEKEDRDYDREYRDENLPELIDEMHDDGKFTDHEVRYTNRLLENAQIAARMEAEYESMMELAEKEPIYKFYLQHVNGVGAVTTAKLIHVFGYCEDRDHVSEIWSYAGMAPGQRRRRGEKLDFNPDAKTLAWLCANQMMRCGDKSMYRTEFYIPYKHKQLRRMEQAKDMTDAQLEEVKWTPPQSKQHAHNRAIRYMAKKFLAHYCVLARHVKGLETPDPWIIEHGGHEKREESFEDAFYARDLLADRS